MAPVGEEYNDSMKDDVLGEIRIRALKDERVLITTLTKRMAEDLTDFLDDNGVRVRYLHSDIDTVERVEIIRDLRLGEFDVLVGINLLREGLDMPEVSLVAILDSDKEGFMRSERSLIQTIGHAARNLEGRAILYADRMTDSMRRAIDETERRRERQEAHNTANNIIPFGVRRMVTDIMEGARESARNKRGKVAEGKGSYTLGSMTKAEIEKQIAVLEKSMFQAAKNLAFEDAANLRDQIEELRQQFVNS